MTGLLAVVDAVLAATVVALLATIVGVRKVAVRRRKLELRLRPAAELAVAEYLAGSDASPPARRRDERVIMLQVCLDALNDLRGSERIRLLGMLRQLGFTGEAEAALGRGRRASRRRAAETLAAIATPAVIPALTAGLADRDPLVRTTCARTLAEAGGDAEAPAVAAAVRRDFAAVPGPAAAVVLALGMHHPAALAPLLGPDVAAGLRTLAVTVTGELRIAEHAALLRGCLAGPDDLAAAAARGLGRIGEIDAVPALMALASEPGCSPTAREAAVTALGSIGDVTAAGLLEAQLRVPEWSLRTAAAGALAQLGEPGTAALSRAAGSADVQVREPAEAAMQS